jgi:hypothetical protein
VDAAIDDEEIVHVVDLAAAVDDGGLGIVAHAARARLVLAAADASLARDAQPGADGARLFEPELGFERGEPGDLDDVGMLAAGEAEDGQASVIFDQGRAARGAPHGHLLDRAAHDMGSGGLLHPFQVSTPTRDPRRRLADKLVGAGETRW